MLQLTPMANSEGTTWKKVVSEIPTSARATFLLIPTAFALTYLAVQVPIVSELMSRLWNKDIIDHAGMAAQMCADIIGRCP